MAPQSAKSISKTMGGELLRIQFSMMQTTEAYNYVFGAEHSKGSFARDMMARESNVILIDEFDKVDMRVCKVINCEIVKNAKKLLKLTLFDGLDERVIVSSIRDDYTPEELIGRKIIVIANLKPAKFAGVKSNGMLIAASGDDFGCCIAYEELSTEQKQTIVHNWYESILSVLKADEKEEIEKTDILDWFIKNAERYDNIRILKTKLENAIFDRLSEVFIIS